MTAKSLPHELKTLKRAVLQAVAEHHGLWAPTSSMITLHRPDTSSTDKRKPRPPGAPRTTQAKVRILPQ